MDNRIERIKNEAQLDTYPMSNGRLWSGKIKVDNSDFDHLVRLAEQAQEIQSVSVGYVVTYQRAGFPPASSTLIKDKDAVRILANNAIASGATNIKVIQSLDITEQFIKGDVQDAK